MADREMSAPISKTTTNNQPWKTTTMRTKNSCRFATYYKIERYDGRSCAFKPVNKSFATADEARAFFYESSRSAAIGRVIEVSEKNGYDTVDYLQK